MYVTVLAIVSSPSHCYFFGGVGCGWLRGRYSKTFQGMDYSRFPEAGEQILGEITNIFIIRGHRSSLKMGKWEKLSVCYQAVRCLILVPFFLVVLS